MAASDLTAARLRELLHYDPETGVFTRKVCVYRRGKPGEVAGTSNSLYVRVSVDGGRYYAHRLAWLYMTGEWPTDEIDHRDTDPGNNRFANLRPADSSFNKQNIRRARVNSKSGLIGSSKHTDANRWVAHIRANGKVHSLGNFATAELAHQAYIEAKRRLHQGNTL